MTEAPGTEELIRRAEELSRLLDEETALLEALDLAAATTLLPQKEQAVAALQEAAGRAAAEGEPDEEEPEAEDLDGDAADGKRERLRQTQEALCEAVSANCGALTRSLDLQTRLMQAIAKAIPAGRAAEAPSYQPDGRKVPVRPPEAYAFQRRM